MLLTSNEQKLFAKYYGRKYLLEDDSFWEDVFMLLSGHIILLPLAYNPKTVRVILDLLECEKCGKCCYYKDIPITGADIDRIIDNTKYNLEYFDRVIVKNSLCGQPDGCPFLEDNKCKIYKFRPDTCYFYPIQGSVDAIINDKPNRQMRIKIKCLSSLNVARKIITKALSEENGILLPNLTIIPLEV